MGEGSPVDIRGAVILPNRFTQRVLLVGGGGKGDIEANLGGWVGGWVGG